METAPQTGKSDASENKDTKISDAKPVASPDAKVEETCACFYVFDMRLFCCSACVAILCLLKGLNNGSNRLFSFISAILCIIG